MSQSFDVVCNVCRKRRHLGQDMGGLQTFGYGSRDEKGRNDAMKFIVSHLYCDLSLLDNPEKKHGFNQDGTPRSTCGAPYLRILLSDDSPDNYTTDIEDI